jgi:hypothetical protein
MNKVFISLGFGLIVILSTYLTVSSTVYAQNINGLDPKVSGCNNDATTIRSISKVIPADRDYTSKDRKIFIRKGNPITVEVELRQSRRCQAKWVKAKIPKGTILYLKDSYIQKKYASYTAILHGWNYGNMWDSRQTLQACVIKLSASYPYNGELCTQPG